MRINEVITEASATNFAKEVGSDVADIPVGIWDRVKDTAKAAVDPETYVKAGQNFRDAAERGIEFAKKDPRGALKYAGQTADDYVRATANKASFGLADKAQAGLNALTGIDTSDPMNIKRSSGSYEKELKKEYGDTIDAKDRSPNATAAGDVSGLLISPAFGAGIKTAGYVGKAVAPSIAKALAPVTGQTTRNIAKGLAKTPANLAAGISAEKAAEKGLKKLDPNDPHLFDVNEETLRLKELIKYRY
jgi:hypothetical protein